MKIFDDFLKKIEQYSIGLILLLTAILLFVNVVLRFFGASLMWSEELARYSIVWLTFIGMSVCVYKNAHIGVDALLNFLGAKEKKIVTLATILIAIVFSVFFTYYSFLFTVKMASTHQMSASLKVSMTYVYAAMPVGGALTTIRYIQQFVNKLKEGEIK